MLRAEVHKLLEQMNERIKNLMEQYRFSDSAYSRTLSRIETDLYELSMAVSAIKEHLGITIEKIPARPEKLVAKKREDNGTN